MSILERRRRTKRDGKLSSVPYASDGTSRVSKLIGNKVQRYVTVGQVMCKGRMAAVRCTVGSNAAFDLKVGLNNGS